MVNPQLEDYISKERALKIADGAIRANLIAAGWSALDVDEGLKAVTGPVTGTVASSLSSPFKRVDELKSAALTPELKTTVSPAGTAGAGSTGMLKKLPWKIIAIVIGALIIIAGGAYGYYWYDHTPDKILARSKVAMAAVTTFTYNFEANITGTNTDTPDAMPTKAKITLAGSADDNLSTNLKSYLTAQIKVEGADVPSADNTPMTIGIEARTIGSVLYLQLTDAPDLGIIDLGSFTKKWVSMNIEQQIKEESGKDAQWSQAKIDKIKQASEKYNISVLTGELPKEVIDGQKVYHYSFVIDEIELKKFLLEAAEIMEEKAPADDVRKDIDELMQVLGPVTGDMYIATTDYTVRKLVVRGTSLKTEENNAVGSFEVSMLLKDFNKPITVEVPAGAMSLEDIMSQAFAEIQLPTSTMQPAGNDTLLWGDDAAVPGDKDYIWGGDNTSTDTDKDGLSDDMEELIGTDPKKADSDGDGFNDADEMDKGYNPLGPGKIEDMK